MLVYILTRYQTAAKTTEGVFLTKRAARERMIELVTKASFIDTGFKLKPNSAIAYYVCSFDIKIHKVE